MRLTFSAGQVRFLGESGDDYVVGTARRNGDGNFRMLRVTPADERTTLFTDVPIWVLTLSQDDLQLIRPRTLVKERKTALVVRNAEDGTVQTRRTFAGYVNVLDADEGRMVLGGWGPNRTFWWDTADDSTEKIRDRVGYAADIRADRLAVFTKDPYRGGCSVTSSLGDPGTTLWRSCRQRVYDFAPAGTRMATVHLLSDGIGPDEITLRRAGGKALVRYTTGWFGAVSWESDASLLLEAHGKKKSALVRCQDTDCELATDPTDTQVPRPVSRSSALRTAPGASSQMK